MKQRQEWTARVTASAGKQIALHGARAHLSVQALADRCAALGLPLGRVTISKLELGTRQSLSTGELMVLACALGVPPADLIFPAGQGGVEILPGQALPAWDAVRWFCGSAALTQSPDGQLRIAPPPYRSPGHLFDVHESVTAQLAGVAPEETWGRSA